MSYYKDLQKAFDDGLSVSEMPEGATGYDLIDEQQVLNELADTTGITIIEADDFLKKLVIPKSYALPPTLNTLDWWEVFNQGAIGSCLGCSDAQTATGVHWLETNEVVEFSKFGHYLLIQWIGNMLGRDVGSVPTDALKVAAKIGYCPETWSDHLEALYVKNYNEPSGFTAGQQMAPKYPRNYTEGLNRFRQWMDVATDENSKTRRVMRMFKMDKYIRITKVEQIIKAKRAGIGFIQQSSTWPSSMDEHPTRIDHFGSRITNRVHGGGHAYQVMDITPSGELVYGNTWGKGNAKGNQRATKGWGDEGVKTVPQSVGQEIIDHRNSIVFLKTDMPLDDVDKKHREIPIRPSSFLGGGST